MEQEIFQKLVSGQAKLEQRMDNIEKEVDKQGMAIGVLDQRTDEMAKFAIKIDLVVDQLDKTTKSIETNLNNFISKQEAREERAREDDSMKKDQEIGKWKTVTFEILKWTLILFGAGSVSQEAVGIVENFFK